MGTPGGGRTGRLRAVRWVAGVTAGALAMVTASAAGAAAGAAPAGASAHAATATSPLQSAWLTVLAERPIEHALIGAYAYDVTTGKTLGSIHPDWRLTPGSVTKLYASATALADWGSRFKLVTRVEQARAGGPLYLVGDGDGFDASTKKSAGAAQLEQLARSVARTVHRAAGVVGVGSLFTGWQAGPGWDVSEVPGIADPVVSALTADMDNLYVAVSPGVAAGRAPVVRLDPNDADMLPPGFFKIENQATTGPRGSAKTLYINTLIGTRTVVITGRIPLGSGRTWGYLSVGDPALFTADLFAKYLKQDGVRLTSANSAGKVAAHSREIASYTDSRDLTSYLREQNSWSVNLMAENLYRLDGVAYRGTGSPAAAQGAVNAYLSHAHLSSGDRVQVDGSGLSVLDEMSARQLVQLLTYVSHQGYFTEFEHSLIHIGRTSQCTFMCGLMDNTAADGTVWLKTGNLANQWNYAGYAQAKNGNLIAFALFFDGLSENNPLGESLGPVDRMTEDAASWPFESKPESAARQRAQLAALNADSGDLPASVAADLPASVAATVRRDYARGDEVSAAVTAVPTGKLLAQSNGQTELQGGLLARLATVSTALDDASSLRLSGPAVSATGPVSGGSVDGDLVLRGNSDALLSAQQLTELAQSVAARGIKQVTGHLDYFAANAGQQWGIPNLPFSTPYEDIGAAFDPPLAPLTVNDDRVTIVVRGTAAGPAQASASPAGAEVTLTGSVRTTSSGGNSAAAAYVPGTHSYLLSGSVRPGSVTQLTVAPPYPGLEAAGVFEAALRQAGVAVSGAPVAVTSASGTVLASESAPTAAAEAQAALTSPSDVAPFDLYTQLGTSNNAKIAARIGSYDQVIDPSGNAADDFLSADSIAQMLASLHARAQAGPVVTELSQPWVVQLPERTTIAGYARTARGQLVAYTVIVNGELYRAAPDSAARYAPRISS